MTSTVYCDYCQAWTNHFRTCGLPPHFPLERIDAERAMGWVNFHPEDYCHRCGNRNIPSWHTESVLFNLAVGDGWEGIVCPPCFALLHEEATGEPTTWAVVTSNYVAKSFAIERFLRKFQEAEPYDAVQWIHAATYMLEHGEDPL